MGANHAQQILAVLAEWFNESESGPHAGSLLFDDDRTLKEHINMALGGIMSERDARRLFPEDFGKETRARGGDATLEPESEMEQERRLR